MMDKFDWFVLIVLSIIALIFLTGCDARQEIQCSNSGVIQIRAPSGNISEPYVKQRCTINQDGTITLKRIL